MGASGSGGLDRWSRPATQRLVRSWRGLVRDLVFGRPPWLRARLRAIHARDLRLLEPCFEPDFYLLQFDKARFAAMAARDPALHYLLLGHRQGFSPALHFDPRHYRQSSRGVPPGAPYLHYLRTGRSAGREPAPSLALVGTPDRPAALILDHARGGGSTGYLDHYSARLVAEGFRPLRTRRIGARRPLYVIADADGTQRSHLLSKDSADLMASLRVERVVFNHLIDLPPGAFAWAKAWASGLGLEYEVLLHDYYLACPRVNLVDAEGRFCDLPDRACAGCPGGAARQSWRAGANELLTGAVRVSAPSTDLATRLQRVFKDVAIEVWEPEADPATLPARPRLLAGEALHLVILGGLNQPKGYDVVLRLARRIRLTGAPIRLTLLGDSSGARALRREGVAVHGRYAEGQVAELLDQIAPHATFFPAIWPETWSFTLTHVLRHGLFAIAFDIGAIAARLRRLSTGRLLPYALHEDASALLDTLMALRAEFLQDAER